MRHENEHQPVILLLDGGPSADNKFIKRWFQKSRFLTCEATDIFQALEDVSDFTMPQRPDVVLLEVKSMPEQFQVIRKMIQTPAGQSEMPIFAFSESGKRINHKECFEGNLAELEARLNQMIPAGPETHSARAA
jgi:CheY-like chemotaxis protein